MVAEEERAARSAGGDHPAISLSQAFVSNSIVCK
jgi:hypothetical protein